MTGSQLLGVLFLVSGLSAFVLRRDDLVAHRFASDAVLLVIGVSCMLVGAIFLLLGYLQKSVQT